MKKIDDMTQEEIWKSVKDAYSKVAKKGTSCCTTKRLKTDKCGCSESLASSLGYSTDGIPDSAVDSFAGCGNPTAIESINEGETVLDLGSGAGLDVFIASKKVGKNGLVIGIDMTKEMLESARKSAEEMGLTNIEFREGKIENIPVQNSSIDIVISNCVINLSTDKEKVFNEVFRVLKSGGRLMVSDIVLTGELPDSEKDDIDSYTGCIAGAVPENEYLSYIESSGFKNIRITSRSDSDFWSSISAVGYKD